MNRAQRRQRERKKRRNDIQKKKGITPLEHQQVINSLNAVKGAALLALRNKGYGAVRLKEFSDNFNEILSDVSDGWLSLSEIFGTLEEETGLKREDLMI